MSLMYHDTVIAGTPVIDSTPTAGSNHAVSSGGVKSAITNVESDLASIHATGTTNTTDATITAGTYFYLNATLVRAKADIAVNATFTNGTNYEPVTAGGLNDLQSHSFGPPDLANTIFFDERKNQVSYTATSDCWVNIAAQDYDVEVRAYQGSTQVAYFGWIKNQGSNIISRMWPLSKGLKLEATASGTNSMVRYIAVFSPT